MVSRRNRRQHSANKIPNLCECPNCSNSFEDSLHNSVVHSSTPQISLSNLQEYVQALAEQQTNAKLSSRAAMQHLSRRIDNLKIDFNDFVNHLYLSRKGHDVINSIRQENEVVPPSSSQGAKPYPLLPCSVPKHIDESNQSDIPCDHPAMIKLKELTNILIENHMTLEHVRR